ncbi:hypothetical protein [Leptolyngbya sp. O-77]|uniref:hypothetical protein n=1 Tax=Leptolyngbya sp. O-77 TaxID=1080068 RepID=UPI00074D3FC4|nr:hypothetical protein [Leptolyngbya sp. O-77]BAU43867.1 hypothetical protein O77CONTIG1_03699 [Leptolyngbya sp. O-77]
MNIKWTAPSAESLASLQPRVWQDCDRTTQKVQWHVYDPISGEAASLESQADVEKWLAHRAYS